MSPKTKPLANVEVDDEKPASTLSLPLDWKGTLNLNKSVKSLRLLLDKEGNIIGFPVILINPSTGGQYSLAVDPTSLAAIAAAVWTDIIDKRRLSDGQNALFQINFNDVINAAATYEFSLANLAGAKAGIITIYCADVAVLVEIRTSAGWVTLDTFAAKKVITVGFQAAVADTVGNLRIRNGGVNNNVVWIASGMGIDEGI